jgi:hypothetical protein
MNTTSNVKKMLVGALLSGGFGLAGLGLSIGTAQAFNPQPEPPGRPAAIIFTDGVGPDHCVGGQHCGTPGGVDKGPTTTNEGNGVGGAGGADVGNHTGASH